MAVLPSFRKLRHWLRWPARIMLAWLILSWSLVAFMRYVPPARSAFMLQYSYHHLRTPDTPRLHYQWVSWERINPEVPLAMVAAEDQRFRQHHGFDFTSIRHAFRHRKNGLRGASTITQQTAKNLFLWPQRSWLRKGIEAYFTVLLELTWPKERILEMYVNMAEFGYGIYGIGAASQHFFGVPPAQLTRRQAALLAAVLPNPKERSPVKPSAQVANRTAWIERQMRQLGGTAYIQSL